MNLLKAVLEKFTRGTITGGKGETGAALPVSLLITFEKVVYRM